MGKIIRNGIEYCGTSDTADNIIYDNKDSGLESTTTQGAIDELSEKVKSGGNIEYLTQAQYDALSDDKLTNGVEYRITDAGSMGAAENVGYDNSKSGIAAVNVQDAIDGLNDSLVNFKAYIPSFGTTYGRGAIPNALEVNIASAESEYNKAGYVYYGYTTQLPINCRQGIREVYYYNQENVFVKIIGSDSTNNYNEWGNFYNGTTWSGWIDLSNNKLPHIEYGIATNGSVTFEKPFSEEPSITLTIDNPNDKLLFSLYITSKSTTGFTYICRYSGVGDNEWIDYFDKVNYIAVGK